MLCLLIAVSLVGSSAALPAASAYPSSPAESGSGGAAISAPAAAKTAAGEPHARVWLLKTTAALPEAGLSDTEVIGEGALPGTWMVRPHKGADRTAWADRLRRLPGTVYLQPAGSVHALAVREPDDPRYDKQAFLKLIRAPQAWSGETGANGMIIALVDTGVDLDHPDLKGNLVAGANLLNPGAPPEDDNGHGTNVAGVLAAVGNNGLGTTGVLWKASVMPIKALDAAGSGDEAVLGEAITYAVKHGARIVVLSVGIYQYSPYLRDIAAYAEDQGVLLVAASGNDGLKLGAKAAVTYPAAYPTVLAVGGVRPNGLPEPRSNPGQEVDVAAAWDVYTTGLGGGYLAGEGTSMAAPQAAAVAALVWAKHPSWKPFQIRETLRRSAKDTGPAGWDAATGYGLVQADKAVAAEWRADGFEPNDSAAAAKRLPLFTQSTGALNGGADRDWYVIDAPYDGTLHLSLKGLPPAGGAVPAIRATLRPAAGGRERSQTAEQGISAMDWSVPKGKSYIGLQLEDGKRTAAMPYLLAADFQVGPDAYEPNDQADRAFALKPSTQTLTGTFHDSGDRDWYSVTFPTGGSLRLEVDPDSARIDPALAYSRSGSGLREMDANGEGQAERTPVITVEAGTYAIRVRDASAGDASPVPASYKLKLTWTPRYSDPNEPNNSMFSATAVGNGSVYGGVIGQAGDTDWYRFSLDTAAYVTVKLADIPQGIPLEADLYDKGQKQLASAKRSGGSLSAAVALKLDQGVYYVKVRSVVPFDSQLYRIAVDTEPLVGGFRDIADHWARPAIAGLSAKGMVSGDGRFLFRPDAYLTRAEAVSLLVAAFGGALPEAADSGFGDVPKGHWASASVAKATAAGWVSGVAAGRFAPNRQVTRAELAVMTGRALDLAPVRGTAFPDAAAGYWGTPMLAALQRAGVMAGAADGRMEPERRATRAEAAAMVYRAVNRKG